MTRSCRSEFGSVFRAKANRNQVHADTGFITGWRSELPAFINAWLYLFPSSHPTKICWIQDAMISGGSSHVHLSAFHLVFFETILAKRSSNADFDNSSTDLLFRMNWMLFQQLLKHERWTWGTSAPFHVSLSFDTSNGLIQTSVFPLRADRQMGVRGPYWLQIIPSHLPIFRNSPDINSIFAFPHQVVEGATGTGKIELAEHVVLSPSGGWSRELHTAEESQKSSSDIMKK